MNNLKGIRSADISFMDSTGLHIPDETARHFWREEETGRYQQDRIHRKAKECQRKLNSHE
ncbi:MAG: hypothetical protein U5K31_03335 [Balneolaceae bacterium]|nr:hypothetical protein [Balneolaceae bacterium]